MTYLEGRSLFRKELKPLFEVKEIDFYFKTILKSFFKIDPTAFALDPHRDFNKSQEDQLGKVLQHFLSEKPLQYIIGKSYFRDLMLEVNKSVLIPRPETEELVSWVLEDHNELSQNQTVLDCGTGSGCIAIALAKEQTKFEVFAVDVDPTVLEVGIQNAFENNAQVKFIKQDILNLESLDLKVNIIVSNPPYITPSEQIEMKPNVLKHEPHLALFVPEEDPLIYYRSILEYGMSHLVKKGLIYFEINPRFLTEMKNLILSYEMYTVEERKDIFDKMRMLKVQKKEYGRN